MYLGLPVHCKSQEHCTTCATSHIGRCVAGTMTHVKLACRAIQWIVLGYVLGVTLYFHFDSFKDAYSSVMAGIEEKDGAGTVGELDVRPQTSAFTQCMLEMEKELVPLIYELNQQCKPMLHSVKIINDAFTVLLSIVDIPNGAARASFADAEYACNGISNVTKVIAKGVMIVLECPVSIRASQTILSTVSVRAAVTESAKKVCPFGRKSQITGDGNETTTSATEEDTDVVMYTYNTKIFDKCEREDIRHHEGQGLGGKTGVHAVFIGDRQKAFEWAAYHHLIGFDHVWLYVNDDWNNGKGLIHRDYITWIPYNFNLFRYEYSRMRGNNPMDVFRVMGQNDGLWRAKRMGLDWFAAMDFDEYIRIDSPSLSNNITFRSSLEAFGPGVSVSDIDSLPKFLNVFKKRMGEKYLGIQTNSIFFGRGPDEKEQRNTNNTADCYSKSFDIDYVWRQKGDPGKFGPDRYKLILDVSCSLSVFIHYLQGNSCPGKEIWIPNANDLRHNHYKQASNGVFWKGRRVHPPDKVEKDNSMVDKYRKKLADEVCSAGLVD